MKIQGKILQVFPLQGGTSKSSGKEWTKASLLIETDEQYPRTVYLSNMNNAAEFAALPPGALYSFDIDVASREFNGRWYTDVNAWKWTPVQSSAVPAPQGAWPSAPAQPPQPAPGFMPDPNATLFP